MLQGTEKWVPASLHTDGPEPDWRDDHVYLKVQRVTLYAAEYKFSSGSYWSEARELMGYIRLHRPEFLTACEVAYAMGYGGHLYELGHGLQFWNIAAIHIIFKAFTYWWESQHKENKHEVQ